MGLVTAAHALSLGELVVQSGLGQPFLGTVRYTTPRGGDVQPLCIRTRYNAAAVPSGLPELPDPRIEVQPGEGGGVIVISTARPVDEPVMRLYLAINCGASTTFNREFMLALDPPRVPLQEPARAAPPAVPGRGAAAPVVPRPGRAPAAVAAASSAIVAPALAPSAAAEARAARRARGAAPAAAPLPYEPGVTPPPGRRAGSRVSRQAAAAAPQYRLSLSRPGDENAKLSLRSTDTLDSLGSPAATVTQAQRDRLALESKMRLADDPLALTLQMQERLNGLEDGFRKVREQVAGYDEERRKSQERIRQLEEEKQSLSAWLNGMALALGFVGCVAVAALLFWTYRRRAEQRGALARHLEPLADRAPPADARIEPSASLEEQFDDTPWRADSEAPGVPAQEPPAAPPAALRPEQAAKPAKPAKAIKPAKADRLAPTPPRAPARVATPAPTPPQSAPVLPEAGERSHTVTFEMPRQPAVPPVEDFYANPPLGAPDLEHPFVLDPPEPEAAPEALIGAVGSDDLAPVSFPPPAPEPEQASAQQSTGAPLDQTGPIEFSMEIGAPAGAVPLPKAGKVLAEALSIAYVPPDPRREPAPTNNGLTALVDDAAAAQLAVAPLPVGAPAPVVTPLPLALPGATGAHRTLDIELGEDDEAEMRAQLYRQEFELKLFPEIVHGQARLSVPQSIISLARTYYQEDFDTNRAINLLEYAADRTPDPQRVRLALLEILRMEGLAREYVAVARSFRKQFPDAEEWATLSAYGKLLAPEEALFKSADVTGYDLNMPSMWLGSTLDMTRYVLAQDMHDAMHGPAPGVEELV